MVLTVLSVAKAVRGEEKRQKEASIAAKTGFHLYFIRVCTPCSLLLKRLPPREFQVKKIILNIPQKVTFCAGNFWKYAGLRNFLIFHEDDRQFPVGHTMIYLLS